MKGVRIIEQCIMKIYINVINQEGTNTSVDRSKAVNSKGSVRFSVQIADLIIGLIIIVIQTQHFSVLFSCRY